MIALSPSCMLKKAMMSSWMDLCKYECMACVAVYGSLTSRCFLVNRGRGAGGGVSGFTRRGRTAMDAQACSPVSKHDRTAVTS